MCPTVTGGLAYSGDLGKKQSRIVDLSILGYAVHYLSVNYITFPNYLTFCVLALKIKGKAQTSGGLVRRLAPTTARALVTGLTRPQQSLTFFIALLCDLIANALVILSGKLFIYCESCLLKQRLFIPLQNTGRTAGRGLL